MSTPPVPDAHAVPECILANDLILEPGAECARCNEALGTVDRELVRHNRLRGPIMRLAVPGKGGRPRKELGPLRRDPKTGDFRILGVAKVASWDAETKKLELELPGHDELDDGRFRRALHHMAFSYLVHKFGLSYGLEDRFAPVRAYIRKPPILAKWPYVQTLLPDDQIRRQLRMTLMEEGPGLTVRFQSFIDDFSWTY